MSTFSFLIIPEKVFSDKSFKNFLRYIPQQKVDSFLSFVSTQKKIHIHWEHARHLLIWGPCHCPVNRTHSVPWMLICGASLPSFCFPGPLLLQSSTHNLWKIGEAVNFFPSSHNSLLKLQINFHNMAGHFFWDCDSIYLECKIEGKEECRPAPSRGRCLVWSIFSWNQTMCFCISIVLILFQSDTLSINKHDLF